jgi:uncharacterized protein
MRHTGAVHAAALRFDLRIPGTRSLKEKRAVVRPLVEGARHRFHCSVAEVGHQDRWQRAAIGVAVVAGDAGHLDEVLDAVERWVVGHPEVEVLDVETTYLDDGGTLADVADDGPDPDDPDPDDPDPDDPDPDDPDPDDEEDDR